MNPQMQTRMHTASLWFGIAAIVTGCATPPPPSPTPAPKPAAAAPTPAPFVEPGLPIRSASASNNLKDYRRDVATHLYTQNAKNIFQGKMPPLLYAVGVLETDIDARGYVAGVRWVRAPMQAPEVMAEIERLVRQASPYPAPVKIGRVTYTDTWLWHKSGKFQLHTLSEGQF